MRTSGEDLNNGADMLANMDIANIPSSDILHQPEASTLPTRPEGDTAPLRIQWWRIELVSSSVWELRRCQEEWAIPWNQEVPVSMMMMGYAPCIVQGGPKVQSCQDGYARP